MIDIIIPAYNAHDTIKRTLSSIAMQTIKDKVKVTIVDDCSDENYNDIVKLFKRDLNIKSIRLDKNSGPGVSRQYGIDNTKEEYIIFIDSDDTLYDCFALENMLNSSDNYDIVVGQLMDIEYGETTILNDHMGVVHSKMYRRKFLEKEKIRFNSYRTSEDHSFNRLCFMANPKVNYIDSIVYVYEENNKSLTKKDEYYLIYASKDFADNMIWMVDEAEKRKYSKEKIAYNLLETITYLYKIYNIYYFHKDKDIIKNNSRKLIEKYRDYDSILSDDEIRNIYADFTNGIMIYETFLTFMELF